MAAKPQENGVQGREGAHIMDNMVLRESAGFASYPAGTISIIFPDCGVQVHINHLGQAGGTGSMDEGWRCT